MSDVRHLRRRAIVRILYNRGARPLWNAFAGPLRAPLLPSVSRHASGGRLPASRCRNRGLIALFWANEDPSEGVGESKSPA